MQKRAAISYRGKEMEKLALEKEAGKCYRSDMGYQARHGAGWRRLSGYWWW